MSLGGPHCEFDGSRCRICGLETQRPELRRNCIVKMRFVALGDFVESSLRSVGITKERVSLLMKTDCGCPERKAWLNRIGYLLQERTARAAATVRESLLGKNW